MAEALPVADDLDVSAFRVPEDPYECSEHFGIGLKTSPFLNAGSMQNGTVVTAKVETAFEGHCFVLRDVMVPDTEVPKSFWVEGEKLERWRYYKGAKREQRVNKSTGHVYNYSEGALPFPDSVDSPARTILTSEGGGSASRTTHIVQVEGGRYRRLVPDELDQLQGFPKGWTNTGMSPRDRAFCMGNALVVGVVHRIGEVIARRDASG